MQGRVGYACRVSRREGGAWAEVKYWERLPGKVSNGKVGFVAWWILDRDRIFKGKKRGCRDLRDTSLC